MILVKRIVENAVARESERERRRVPMDWPRANATMCLDLNNNTTNGSTFQVQAGVQ